MTYYTSFLNSIGFKATQKVIADANYFSTIGNLKLNPQTGFADWNQDFPNPIDFYLLLQSTAILPTNNENFGQVDDPHINSTSNTLGKVRPAAKPIAAQWQALDTTSLRKPTWASSATRRSRLHVDPDQTRTSSSRPSTGGTTRRSAQVEGSPRATRAPTGRDGYAVPSPSGIALNDGHSINRHRVLRRVFGCRRWAGRTSRRDSGRGSWPGGGCDATRSRCSSAAVPPDRDPVPAGTGVLVRHRAYRARYRRTSSARRSTSARRPASALRACRSGRRGTSTISSVPTANGRDVAVRLLYGGRNSLEIGAVATLITMFLALIIGVLAGYSRGILDGIIYSMINVIWAYPALLLGVALGTVLAVGGIGPLQHLAAGAGGGHRVCLHPLRRRSRLEARCSCCASGSSSTPPASRGCRTGRSCSRDHAQPGLHDHRVHPADPRQRDPARGGADLPRRGRPAAEPFVGDDDLATASRRSRRRSTTCSCPGSCSCSRSCRSTSLATVCATRLIRAPRSGSLTSDGQIHHPPAGRDGPPDGRDLVPDVPDLRADSQRRSGRQPRRSPRDRRRDRLHPPRVWLRPIVLSSSTADDEEHLHRPGVLVLPGLQRDGRDQAGTAGDAVAGDWRRAHLALDLDRRGHRWRRSAPARTRTEYSPSWRWSESRSRRSSWARS